VGVGVGGGGGGASGQNHLFRDQLGSTVH